MVSARTITRSKESAMHPLPVFTAAVLLSLFPAASRAAGTFVASPITGDADSGISLTKTYTHAVDFAGRFGGVDPGTSVNGVPFLIGGTSGPNYSTTGLVNDLA